METVTRVVRGAGGEAIRVAEFGAPEGKPVLVHPGTPGSRRLYAPDAELAAREFGLRLLSFDRPGYGGRARREGRCVADGVADVRDVARELGIERLGVWGLSGGGPYALACAALLPELVAGAAVFASFAPYGMPGLDFCGEWPEEYRREVEMFFTDRPAAREIWRKDTERLFAGSSTAEGWMARWGDAAGTDEAHGWDLARHLAALTCDALADGDDGYWDDWAATLTPWGFDVGAVRVPVRLWHGARDRNVPVTNGRWLAAHIPGVVAGISDDGDHSTVEDTNKRTAYAWLAGLL